MILLEYPYVVFYAEGIFVVSESVSCTFVSVKSYQCYSQVISREIR
jgi:hypothetical protein